MQANWSLVLNILFLIMVFVAIGRVIKERRKNTQAVPQQPSVGQVDNDKTNYDDIIAVRRVNAEAIADEVEMQPSTRPILSPSASSIPQVDSKPILDNESAMPLMIFLLAKENRQLAGYELLQTLLAAGLRFGEGQLFHRHQHANGQGPVLCSLAAATPSGVFDLQNIGAFSVHGLCLFMHPSGNSTIDAERFAIMHDTAKQLSDGLDTHLLDDNRRPFTDASLRRYYQQLSINHVGKQFEPVN